MLSVFYVIVNEFMLIVANRLFVLSVILLNLFAPCFQAKVIPRHSQETHFQKSLLHLANITLYLDVFLP
jgi:hypothetical protein